MREGRAEKRILAALVMLGVMAPGAQGSERLVYAVVVARHGVRAPTWTPEQLHRYSAEPWPNWGVPPGHLTPHGRELLKRLGGYYGERFAAERLIERAACSEPIAFIRADSDQRTLESARALAEGLFPDCPPKIHALREGTPDPLFDPIEAGTVKPDGRQWLAAVMGRIGPSLEALVDVHRPALEKLDRVLTGGGKTPASVFGEKPSLRIGADGVAMSGPLRTASTLTENLLLEYTNGMTGQEFGWGRLTVAELRDVLTLHTAYADLLQRTPALARARSGNLLRHVLRSMRQAAEGKPAAGALGGTRTKLLVLSGHDTNLSNIAGLLALSWTVQSHARDDVPPGGALVFTLWRVERTGQLLVRTQFVTQTLDQLRESTPLSTGRPPAVADLFVEGCSSAETGYPCEWSAFERVAAGAITGRTSDAIPRSSGGRFGSSSLIDQPSSQARCGPAHPGQRPRATAARRRSRIRDAWYQAPSPRSSRGTSWYRM
jgi:4-phytase/acid phosphatase